MIDQHVDIQILLKRLDFTLTVDLRLPAQGVTVLFGPSGSGKTTLLRCVAGLEKSYGRISVAGDTWQDSEQQIDLPTWQRNLGYVFQEASLFAHLNVQKNLQFGIKRLEHHQRAQADDALSAAIELLGIGHLLQRAPASLSGGERQRVAIARALALQPKILLLDEPLASLDMARRQEILPWLERLHAQLRIPVLYVTHSMQELTRLADHVVLLQSGSVQLHGPIDEVVSNRTFAVAVGGEAGAVLQGTVIQHDDVFDLTQISVLAGRLWVSKQALALSTAVRVHVHANDVSLSLSEPFDTSIQNRLPGVIREIVQDVHPAHKLVSLDCHGQQLLARVTARALMQLKLDVGSPVWCQIKSVAIAGPQDLSVSLKAH
jgi:molybdate transport system ATP-binding protein